MPLRSKAAVVTGSTSGIGLAIAKALAREGADLLINGFGEADEIEAVRHSIESDFGGMIWPFEGDSGSYRLATMLSPIVYADKVKHPMLIIHSLNDYRVPFEEGEQWFRALKKHNVPVKMVAFPDASHGLSAQGEPWLLVRRLNEYVDWFRAYLLDNKPIISS